MKGIIIGIYGTSFFKTVDQTTIVIRTPTIIIITATTNIHMVKILHLMQKRIIEEEKYPRY